MVVLVDLKKWVKIVLKETVPSKGTMFWIHQSTSATEVVPPTKQFSHLSPPTIAPKERIEKIMFHSQKYFHLQK